ncbi:g1893 [Coccomyxa viridis]|uniref:G1893 protein n=1 Tax=Coccomyxa viridis TaxID=1274662 RepID=A0ABP1FL85_9CHLO
MGFFWTSREPEEAKWFGKHVFITGGSEGIGFALAQLFVEQGAKVTLASRSKDKLEHAQTLLQATSAAAQLLTCATDVGSWEQVQKSVRQAEAHFGPLDVVIANAGMPSSKMFEELTVEDYEELNRVNYLGVIYTVKAGYASIKRGASRKGHILIVSSLSGFVPLPGQTAYSATKFALRGFADALQIELRGSGVQLHIAYPGMTQTAMLDAMDARTRGLIGELPGVTVYPCEQVARLMLKGMEQRRYVLRFPDFLSTWICAGLGGTSELCLPVVVTAFLAPLVVIFMQAYRWLILRALRRVRARDWGPEDAEVIGRDKKK